jgi:phosphoglucosamine mutase
MEVRLVGHIPTPGLAYLSKTDQFIAGAVISASHNPAPDNGIKFFDHRAQKLPDSVEDRIESFMTGDDTLPRPTEGGIGLVGDARALVKDYEAFLVSKAPRLEGMRIALDCANGATYRVAPAVFAETGAELHSYFDQPNGQNINDGCGATAPEALQRLVVDNEADAGFAFDGDGDRVIVIDERGRAHNGDFVLALVARHFIRHGRLNPKVVVGTVMTNGGLEYMLARDGVRLERTQVGDRYVWEAMERLGAQFGGESSGHVIFREYSTTGDGILTALEVLHLMRAEGRTLGELADEMKFWPQVTRNVKAARRREWEANDAFRAAKKSAEASLGSTGRLLVRPSGTEPVLRITVEAQNSTVASSTAEMLARVAEKELV